MFRLPSATKDGVICLSFFYKIGFVSGGLLLFFMYHHPGMSLLDFYLMLYVTIQECTSHE